MRSPHKVATAQYVREQGHILEALAGGMSLSGTLDSLGQQFGLTSDELRTCLHELREAGWVATNTEPLGHLTVRIERRSRAEVMRAQDERRRPLRDAWAL